jgi:hypothetical protein
MLSNVPISRPFATVRPLKWFHEAICVPLSTLAASLRVQCVEHRFSTREYDAARSS